MLIKNMDEMLVNGSMGTIVEFVEPTQYLTNPDDPTSSTLNPSSSAKPASSSKPPSKAEGSGGGKASASVEQKWPVVEFLNPRRRVLITPESWKTELPSGEVQVSRTQVCIQSFFLLRGGGLYAHPASHFPLTHFQRSSTRSSTRSLRSSCP